MDMLLRNVTAKEVAHLLRSHDRSSIPQLEDRSHRERAIATAKAQGIWDRLDRWDPGAPIPVLKRSVYRTYRETGERGPSEAQSGARSRELQQAVLALWLDHPRANLPYLEDLLWAYCDDWTWVSAAHENRVVDLGAAILAATLAEILRMFRERLAPEVSERVQTELHRRIFTPFLDYRHPDFWWTVRHNWNAVCNGSVLRAALAAVEDPDALAELVHVAAGRLTYSLDGFRDDGGCVEGPSYWDYGFGHYLRAAHALFERTDGTLNLMADDKCRRIARYPVATHFEGPFRAAFGDADQGYLSLEAALLVNRFWPVPELFQQCRPLADGTLACAGLHELALYAGERAPAAEDPPDDWLPQLGLVTLRGRGGRDAFSVSVLAGDNGVNHSHNDIGSVVVYRGGRLWLTDPGRPIYRQATFSADRYGITLCNADGHSVPVINGQRQEAGAQYFGTLAASGLRGTASENGVTPPLPPTARLDLTRAYPPGTVGQLTRTVELRDGGRSVVITDQYQFPESPREVLERFVTFESASPSLDGAVVLLGDPDDRVELRAEGGRFAVEVLEATAHETRDGRILNRIVFTPDALRADMVLTFVLSS